MDENQERALVLRNTDIEGAMRRFENNESFYISCLQLFLEDETIRELNKTVKEKRWDDAFTAAHALKGLAGNMGFVPLMHAVGQLVVLIRSGRLREVDESMLQVNSDYRDITDAISQNFIQTQGDE